MTQTQLKLGTRGSPLALVQANMVRDALCTAHGWGIDAIEIVPIKTTGDRVQDVALAEIGGKALWTKELDRALLTGEIDFAVHSMKDVETVRPSTIAIAAMLPRHIITPPNRLPPTRTAFGTARFRRFLRFVSSIELISFAIS